MPSFFTKILTPLYIAGSVLTLGVAFFLAQHLYWSDSEMWAATVARGLFSQWTQYAFSLKPLFYLPLWLNYKVSGLWDLWPMQTARLVFAINLGGILLLTGLILRKLNPHAAWKALLGTLLLITSALILERGFRVRSDLLICSLYLVSILLFLHMRTKSSSLVLGFLPAVLALLVSLNSLFFLPLLFPFLPPIRPKRSLGLVLLGFLLICFVFFMSSSFVHSWNYFLESLTQESAGLPYFSWKRFEHLRFWIFKDPHLFALFGLKVAHDLCAWKMRKPFSETGISMLGYWIFFVLLIHPNRMPFFMAALLPFLMIWALELPLLISFLRSHKWRKYLPAASAFLLVMLIAHMIFHSIRIYHSSTNFFQKRFMTELAQQIPKNENLRIWDPVGILPYHPSYLWYLGPAQSEENQFLYELFQKVRPKIVINTQRMAWFPQKFSQDLAHQYSQVHQGLYLRNLIETSEPISEMQVESFLDKIFYFYPWLNKDWSFNFEFLDQKARPVRVTLTGFTGETSLLTQPTRLNRFIGQEKMKMEPPVLTWKVFPQPFLQLSDHPPLNELFRFDAHLGSELSPEGH